MVAQFRYTFLLFGVIGFRCCVSLIREVTVTRITGQRLNHVFDTAIARSATACVVMCWNSPACLTLNFNPSTGECQLCDDDQIWGTLVEANSSWNLYYGSDKCQPPQIFYGSSCYLIVTSRVNWTMADDYCKSLNADLVTINDEAEKQFVMVVAMQAGLDVPWHWIGFNDIDNEGTFGWTTGEAVSYMHFGQGEPNNDGDEDCVIMMSDAGTWHDIACWSEEAFICEKRAYSYWM